MRAATLNSFLIVSTLVISSLSANAAGLETQNDRSCPDNDAAVVILSKDPYCAAHHLSGHACQAKWEEYFVETNRHNRFLTKCRKQHSSGAGSTSGAAATGSESSGSATPATPPSTAPAATSVMEGQQTPDRPQDQPATTQSDRASAQQPNDMPDATTVANSQPASGDAPGGRPSHQKNKPDTSSRQLAVMGPGRLSRPAAMERLLPKTP